MKITVIVPNELGKKIKEKAHDKRVTLSSLIRTILRAFIAKK